MSSSNHYHAFRAREAEILKQWPALAKYVDLLPKQPPLEGSDAARYVADLLSSWPNLASLREPLFTERKEQLLRVRQYAREVGCVETPEEQQWFNRIAGDSAAAVDPTALLEAGGNGGGDGQPATAKQVAAFGMVMRCVQSHVCLPAHVTSAAMTSETI